MVGLLMYGPKPVPFKTVSSLADSKALAIYGFHNQKGCGECFDGGSAGQAGKTSMLRSREGSYGLQPVRKCGKLIRPLGPEVCSSHLLLISTVPQGLKASRMATVVPGINPRPTLKVSFSAAS
jgi:hypothetical protein